MEAFDTRNRRVLAALNEITVDQQALYPEAGAGPLQRAAREVLFKHLECVGEFTSYCRAEMLNGNLTPLSLSDETRKLIIKSRMCDGWANMSLAQKKVAMLKLSGMSDTSAWNLLKVCEGTRQEKRTNI